MRVCACVVLMDIQIKKRDTVLCQDAVYLVLWIVIFAVLRYFAVGQMIGTMF